MEPTLANVDLGRYRRIVQILWDPQPVNDTARDLPVWCLGSTYKLSDTPPQVFDDNICQNPAISRPESRPSRQYQTSESPTSHLLSTSTSDASTRVSPEHLATSLADDEAVKDGGDGQGWPQGFVDDFRSRFWMTYRSGFRPIPRSSDPRAANVLSLSMRFKTQFGDQTGFSSDSGWGCMIRSGQSLLANAMAVSRLGRDWRRGELPQEERRLISLFADDSRAPFSIHNFVSHGAIACGKSPGEWFGPSATARCIQTLLGAHESQLRVYTTGDGPDVYEDRFMKIAKSDDHKFHPTLVLIATRLGIDKITPVYWEALTATLQMPQSVGIAGGRPSSSHYFFGVQGLFLFYLDPHHTRPALPYYRNIDQYRDEDIESCHTSRLRRIHVRDIDPSMLLGFLIRTEEEWKEWRRSIKHVQGKAIIHVADQDPSAASHATQTENAMHDVELLSDDSDMILTI